MTDAWDGMAVEFHMTDTAIIAILKDGAAVQAKGLDLIVQDGRSPVWYGPDDEHEAPRSRLEYRCIVNMVDAEPDQVKAREGIVHIDGTHENGERLTIRGIGWVGRDQDGCIDIIFDDPPEMIFYDDDDSEDEAEGDRQSGSPNVVVLRTPNNAS